MKNDLRTYACPRCNPEDVDALYGAVPAMSEARYAPCPSGFTSHVIQSGETLRGIAQRYDMSLSELLLYNPSVNPFFYKKGDVLCVPSEEVQDIVEDVQDMVEDIIENALDAPPAPDSQASQTAARRLVATPAAPAVTSTPAGDPPAQDAAVPAPADQPEQMDAPEVEQVPAVETPATPEADSFSLSGNQPASPGEGPFPLPTPGLPGNLPPIAPDPIIPLPPIVGPGPVLPTPVPNCPGGTLYTVRRGDTLRIIARRFNIDLDQLMQANPGVTNNRLIVGQLLCIPNTVCSNCCPDGGTPVRIPSGAQFVDFLLRYDVSYSALEQANPTVNLDRLVAGRMLCVPPSGSRGFCPDSGNTYVIPRTMTPAQIAQNLGVTVSALMRQNPNYAPSDFVAGRLICVPAGVMPL